MRTVANWRKFCLIKIGQLIIVMEECKPCSQRVPCSLPFPSSVSFLCLEYSLSSQLLHPANSHLHFSPFQRSFPASCFRLTPLQGSSQHLDLPSSKHSSGCIVIAFTHLSPSIEWEELECKGESLHTQCLAHSRWTKKHFLNELMNKQATYTNLCFNFRLPSP